ncbi:TauD/TfdA family dioxygenase [Streptomyces sp. WMMC905]|uniref:TauD/TfdA family dioxygenase n=1 Tax=Streptomyces sp. WMMC905 TaxID=3404123 RepID=UPI003B92D03A
MTPHQPFDTVRFEIPKELAESTPDVLQAELRQYAERHLDGSPGYFLLAGLDHLDLDGYRSFAVAASSALGRLMPQDGAGSLLREVRDRGVALGEGSTGRYSDSRTGGNLHTDSPHRPTAVPDYFTLTCVHQAAIGGDLLLVRLADVVERLRDHPDALETLRRPMHFDTRDDTPGVPRTVLRPVLETKDNREHVHYLREYIEIGHRQPGVPLSPRNRPVLSTPWTNCYRRPVHRPQADTHRAGPASRHVAGRRAQRRDRRLHVSHQPPLLLPDRRDARTP